MFDKTIILINFTCLTLTILLAMKTHNDRKKAKVILDESQDVLIAIEKYIIKLKTLMDVNDFKR